MDQISSFLEPIDYIVVVGYLLILIAIGYYISFVKNKKSDENLFLAGNTLGWTSIGLNMWGTNVGPSMLIASASVGFTTGIVAGNFAKNEVVKYFNSEIHSELTNADHVDKNGLFIGNQHFDLENAILELSNAIKNI